ncbi:MAG: T9SS type A sorting domain-containing protein, partial [Bacteroidota bacterium]
MLQRIISCFVLLILYANLWSQDTVSIFFIGNSFTYFNNMPGMVEDFAAEAGIPCYVQMHAPGGASVGDTANYAHMDDPFVYDQINSSDWDFIVVQDNQGRFVLDYGVFSGASRTIEGHLMLRDSALANNHCTRMVWFAGWGWKNGYPPYGNTGTEVIQRIWANYTFLNDTAGEIISPIGAAWIRAINQLPQVDLWAADETHPSVYGSYLTAGVIFTSIFRVNPVQLTYNAGINASEAEQLRTYAWEAVNDSLVSTNLDQYCPELFYDTLNNQLIADSLYSYYHWYFNDQPVLSGPDHCFQNVQPGFYCVIAEDSAACLFRSFEIQINPLIIEEMNYTEFIYLYPNPVSNELFLKKPAALRIDSYCIYSSTGMKMLENKYENPSTILIPDFIWSGLYIIQFKTTQGILTYRIIVDR